MAKYDFAEEIQDDILKLMTRDNIFSNAAYFWVKAEYFDGDARQWFVKLFLNFYERYSVSPTISQVATEATQQLRLGKISKDMAKDIAAVIRMSYKESVSGVKEYTLDLVQKFARHRAWENAIMEAYPLLQRGDYDKVDEIMSSAGNMAVDLDIGAYWYFESREERTSRRIDNKDIVVYPTGIVEIDIHLRRGGLSPGEIAVWVAAKGVGKCVSGDSLVYTLNGLKRMDSFFKTDKPGWYNLDHPEFIYDGNGDIREINRVFCNGYGPTKKIRLKNGYSIEATLEHPLLVCKNGFWEWKKVSELSVGDYVAYVGNNNITRFLPINIVSIVDSSAVTYDIEVPESHSFIVNGIVSHNSTALAQMARRAIGEGARVAYYSFEMPTDQNADRLDSGFTGVSMWELEAQHEQLLEELDRIAIQWPKSLMLKQYPTKGRTIQDVRRHLDNLRRLEKWEPQVIILDYISIVKPMRLLSARHQELQENIEEFRGLCGELNMAGWTAAQLNRVGAQKETADDTDIAGSWDQLATADYVFIIAQKDYEKARSEIRVKIDKTRDGRCKIMVGPLVTDPDRMCFARRSNKNRVEAKIEWERQMRETENRERD